MKTYGHSLVARWGIAGLPLFFALMAYLNFIGPSIPRREYHVAICVIFALVTGGLYWKSVLNRYQVSHAGLLVSRLWMTRLIPWEEIDEMTWRRPSHLVVINGKGRTLALVSTQMFGGLMEMLGEIARHSRCKLSPNLAGVCAANGCDEDKRRTAVSKPGLQDAAQES